MRLINGDCHKELEKLDDSSVDLVATDLPYGTTANQWDSVIALDPLWDELYRVAKEDAAFVMTASQPFTNELINSNKDDFRYTLVWEKKEGTNFLRANKEPLQTHEDIVVFYRRQPTYNPQKRNKGKSYSVRYNEGDDITHFGKKENRNGTITRRGKHPRSVQKFAPAGDGFKETVHSTQKPVPLFEWIIKSYSNKDDTVLDPAAGSGTTGVAAKKTGREFIGYEIDDEYYETAEKRIQEAEQSRKQAEKFFEI